ncbi:MAG: hypothetical protein H7Y42_09405 [Chitinophagaceae bacterium]|nr:hypothetical protein [Chitinophagaceae bacterium]
MKRLFLSLLFASVFISFEQLQAQAKLVKNIDELNEANRKAKPGDIIILQDGVWNNVTITLDCSGTSTRPITFRAQTPGKVKIIGQSRLRVGGDYLIVDGLYFTNGFAGRNSVIDFRIDKNKLADHSRVTNCVVDNFNNAKRMEENNWVTFFGKNNRLDHCSFINKKNMGVLLAVILDDERSRENFHSIDHNYFGLRLPLASNGGEIIRVGVSQHCQFNSNTQITDNFFEQCDGETEIISIKSGSNVVRNNLFKECQGAVVLRHGDNNTVENNVFLGNGKEGTGGVRVINKGQWVVNNLFYNCRGVDFRSPLSIMNGIPNSPAHRYVQVTEAVIANNTFYNSSPISFGEGSDTERTLPPQGVYLVNNAFYNKRDSIIYKAYDDISGFLFGGNLVSSELEQETPIGFKKINFTTQKADKVALPYPVPALTPIISDSLQAAAKKRITHSLSASTGFSNLALLKKILGNSGTARTKWFAGHSSTQASKATATVDCKTAEEVYRQLARKIPLTIRLTGKEYQLNKPFTVSSIVIFTGNPASTISLKTPNGLSAFIINGNGNLTLENLSFDGTQMRSAHLISNDSSGSSDHYNLKISRCQFKNFDRSTGCKEIFFAYKSMVADSIIVRQSKFLNNVTDGFMFSQERDDKGYYNAEKIVIIGNVINGLRGRLLDVYRGGNDESTLGPQLFFTGNKITNSAPVTVDAPLINLYGVQRSHIQKNEFNGSHPDGILIRFEDAVRANHLFDINMLQNSGRVIANKYVRSKS